MEAEASALSSVASSQDSLHKQPKKKGIKSSIGRLFGKKEKGRMAHMAHRHVMLDPQGGQSKVFQKTTAAVSTGVNTPIVQTTSSSATDLFCRQGFFEFMQ